MIPGQSLVFFFLIRVYRVIFRLQRLLCRLPRPFTTETAGRLVRIVHFAQTTAPRTRLRSGPVNLFVTHRFWRSLIPLFI